MPDTQGFQKRLLLMKFKNYKISKSLRRLELAAYSYSKRSLQASRLRNLGVSRPVLTQQTNLVNPNSGYLSR